MKYNILYLSVYLISGFLYLSVLENETEFSEDEDNTDDESAKTSPRDDVFAQKKVLAPKEKEYRIKLFENTGKHGTLTVPKSLHKVKSMSKSLKESVPRKRVALFHQLFCFFRIYELIFSK